MGVKETLDYIEKIAGVRVVRMLSILFLIVAFLCVEMVFVRRYKKEESARAVLKDVIKTIFCLTPGGRDLPEADLRNDVAHGGNVTADIMLITFMSMVKPGRADGWKSAFKEQYGLPFDVLSNSELENLPRQFTSTLNFRASVRMMKRWNITESEIVETKATILSGCGTIIDIWRGNKEGDSFMRGDSESARVYGEIQSLYYNYGC
ncbi:hypothetical protein FQN54_004354 [Arachnomyces sp. PD_36]|nr:hypothetical protein FQN54_004354 [Arachnomyces sp. PD_36]